DVVLVAAQQIGRQFDRLTALGRRHTGPGGQSFAGSSEGGFGLSRGCEVTFADDLVLVGGIPYFDFASLTGGNPLTADVIADFNHGPEPPGQKSYRSENRAGHP